MLYNKQLDKQLARLPQVRPPLPAQREARLRLLVDPGSFEERDAGLESIDALGFVDQKPYPERLAAARIASGLRDAAVWGVAGPTASPSPCASWTSPSWAGRWARSWARR